MRSVTSRVKNCVCGLSYGLTIVLVSELEQLALVLFYLIAQSVDGLVTLEILASFVTKNYAENCVAEDSEELKLLQLCVEDKVQCHS